MKNTGGVMQAKPRFYALMLGFDFSNLRFGFGPEFPGVGIDMRYEDMGAGGCRVTRAPSRRQPLALCSGTEVDYGNIAADAVSDIQGRPGHRQPDRFVTRM